MFLMDTNVVSEIRKGKKGCLNVITWAEEVSASSLFLSVITILELETGILLKEKKDPSQGAILRSWFNTHVLPAFSDRILDIDLAIVQRCAKLHVTKSRPGRDTLIAATALVHGFTVVTPNTKDFEETGVELLNPWL